MRRPGYRRTGAGLRGNDLWNEGLIAPRGFEQTPLAAPKIPISENELAKSDVPNAENTPLYPDLALIQDGWPNLPEHIKAAVLALVRNVAGS